MYHRENQPPRWNPRNSGHPITRFAWLRFQLATWCRCDWTARIVQTYISFYHTSDSERNNRHKSHGETSNSILPLSCRTLLDEYQSHRAFLALHNGHAPEKQLTPFACRTSCGRDCSASAHNTYCICHPNYQNIDCMLRPVRRNKQGMCEEIYSACWG